MSTSVWRREIRLWLPALVLLLVNVVALAVFDAFFDDKAEAGRSSVERTRAESSELMAARQKTEVLVKRAERNHRRLERLYRQRFQTQEQRITKMISEVKDLARKAGLNPPTIRYPDDPIEALGLIKRSIVFNVDGTYQSLRKFINFLELTNSFVILEEIRPGDNAGQGKRLSIALKVSTFFLDDDVDPAALASHPQTSGASR